MPRYFSNYVTGVPSTTIPRTSLHDIAISWTGINGAQRAR